MGGGEKTLQDSSKPTSKLMPKDAKWIQAEVERFDPKENAVYTSDDVKVLVAPHVHSKVNCGFVLG